MTEYNFNNFQIPSTGPVYDGAVGDQQDRIIGSRMSNFGALDYGIRSASDYTKIVKGFKDKDELTNPSIPAFQPTGNGGNWGGGAINNPYIVGSTTHKTRSDEFFVTLLGSRNTHGASQPAFDVMSTDLVWYTTVSGSDVPLNFPTEGFKYFGNRVAGPFGYEVS